jgi:hypothetical protein
MPITRVELESFTAFSQLDFRTSPGINILIGANATGKTHLLKVAYAACEITKTKGSLPGKIVRLFLPHQRKIGRLVHRQRGVARAKVTVHRDGRSITMEFNSKATSIDDVNVKRASAWVGEEIESAYIPVKEMLAHAPGFRSLYATREIHFEEVYDDILAKAYLPIPRGAPSGDRGVLLELIRKKMGGQVHTSKEEFFLREAGIGNLEFSLLAEGYRKLGLLWLLIQNGTLPRGSVLFWDEPESNLNPGMTGTIVSVLIELQRMGVQVFLATHDYVLLKEFDLRAKPEDEVLFHALWRDPSRDVHVESTNSYRSIHPNAIADTFTDLYERDIERSLGGSGNADRR